MSADKPRPVERIGTGRPAAVPCLGDALAAYAYASMTILGAARPAAGPLTN